MSLLLGLLSAASAQAQTTYFWRASSTTTATWNDAANWCTSLTDPVTASNSRVTPAADDILKFDGRVSGAFPASVVVGTGPAQAALQQTVGQLQFVNAAVVSLAGPGTGDAGSEISISGGKPVTNNFLVEVGSTLSIVANPASPQRFLLLSMGTGKKGAVSGNVFINTNSSNPSRLVAAVGSSLTFASPAVCTAVIVQGSPFGTTGVNTLPTDAAAHSDAAAGGSVVFKTGAKFVQQGGSSPFGPTSNAVTTFQSGSTYVYNGGNFSTLGQTYGNLQYAAFDPPSSTPVGHSRTMTILNNLNVSSGQLNINVENGNGTSIYGNLVVRSGGTLRFMPGTASLLNVAGTTTIGNSTGMGTLLFSPGTTATASFTNSVTVAAGSSLIFGGAKADVNMLSNLTTNGTLNFSQSSLSTVAFRGTDQVIGGSVMPVFGPNALLEISNLPMGAGSVTLKQNLTVPRGLVLTNGLLNTTSFWLLTMPATATVSGGSDNSFVNGPVARATADGANMGLLFPVGKVLGATTKNYRPLTLDISAQTNAVTYTAEQLDGAPSTQPDASSGLARVSFLRYFNVTPSVAPTGFSGTVTLSFGGDDEVTDPSSANFVIAKRDAANNWASIGRGTSTGTATNGKLTSAIFPTAVAATSFVGSASFALASTSPDLTINPLPVELMRFSAVAKATGVRVEWATGSEQNSASFEVQRSASSQSKSFRTIATVAAQGNSTSAHAYAALDRAPLTGVGYYRLRQVDATGHSAYSPVVAVRWAGPTTVQVYPNPSTGTLYLSGVAGEVPYRIRNAQGQLLASGTVAGAAGLDLQRLPAGLYLLELTTSSGPVVQRFVRQ